MNYGNYPDLSGVKKILVVKMRHHGDVLLTAPLFSALKEALPQATVDAYVYKDTKPMLEGHASISRFFLYDRAWKKLSFFQKLNKERKILFAIRREKYDLVINLTEGDRGAIVAWFSNAKIRVGFDPGTSGFFGKRKVFTHIVKDCKTPRHTVEKQLDVLRRIGIFSENMGELDFHIPEEAKASMRAKLLAGGAEEGEYYLIHPASRWRFKCWPLDKVAKLVEKLHAENKKIVLTSGPDQVEKEMVQEILNKVPHIPVLSLAGQTTLKELGALVKMAKCLICVDSVPLHMASALKTPVVVLFGPSSEKNWGPWQHPRSVVVTKDFSCRPCGLDGCGGSKKSQCLLTLSVKEVWKGLEELQLVAERPSSDFLEKLSLVD